MGEKRWVSSASVSQQSSLSFIETYGCHDYAFFPQEAFIQNILSKPFKIPIPNYTGNPFFSSLHYLSLIPISILNNECSCWYIIHRLSGNQGTWSKACRSEESTSRSLCWTCFSSVWAPKSECSWPDQGRQVGSQFSVKVKFLSKIVHIRSKTETMAEQQSPALFIYMTYSVWDFPKDKLSCDYFLLTFLILSREKLPVHVVVDPVLGKVLRPHQREVKPILFLSTPITLLI